MNIFFWKNLVMQLTMAVSMAVSTTGQVTTQRIAGASKQGMSNQNVSWRTSLRLSQWRHILAIESAPQIIPKFATLPLWLRLATLLINQLFVELMEETDQC